MQNRIFINKYNKKVKGNLHIHTRLDTYCNETEVIDLYKSKGYNFIAISDHDIRYENKETDKSFLIIPSVEISCDYIGDDTLKGAYIHFNILGNKINNNIPLKYKYRNIKDVQKAIDILKSENLLIQFNHPLFSRLTEEEFLSLKNYDFLEIYNHKDFMIETCALNADYLCRSLLNHGRNILVTAGDDFHGNENKTLNDLHIKSFVMVESDLSEVSILEALKKGSFYSSTNPLIYDYRVENDCIKIETSPVKNIIFYTNLRNSKNIFSNNKAITSGEYLLTGKENYIWVKIIDENGDSAWTQPIFLNKNCEKL